MAYIQSSDSDVEMAEDVDEAVFTRPPPPAPERASVRRELRFDRVPQIQPQQEEPMDFMSPPLLPLEDPPSSDRTDDTFVPQSYSPTPPLSARKQRLPSRVSDRQQYLENLNTIFTKLAEFVGAEPHVIKHVCRSKLDDVAARTKRRFVAAQIYISQLVARAINPESPEQLIAAANSGILQSNVKDLVVKEFDHLITLYKAATDKKVGLQY